MNSVSPKVATPGPTEREWSINGMARDTIDIMMDLGDHDVTIARIPRQLPGINDNGLGAVAVANLMREAPALRDALAKALTLINAHADHLAIEAHPDNINAVCDEARAVLARLDGAA